VAEPDRDQGKRDGLGRPGDRDPRRPELDRYGHRDRGDAGRPDDEPERMTIAEPDQQAQGEPKVGKRECGDERTARARIGAVKDLEPGPDREGGVREQQGDRAGLQPADRVADLLAARRDRVEQPEPDDRQESDRQ
jgi:hypothetical protein